MSTARILADARRRPLASAAMVVYLACLGLLTFQPGGATANWAVVRAVDLLSRLQFPPTIANEYRMGVLLNVAMLMPLPMLGMWLLPRTNWRDWTACAFLTSLTIEVLQVPMTTRDASYSDIAANTAGALVGGLLFLAGRWLWDSHRLRREHDSYEPGSPREPLRKAQ
ncbi:MAG: VanZ family protein [Nocardioides sp.]